MRPLLVVNIPGLSLGQIGKHTPALSSLGQQAGLLPVFPAVTMPAHAAMLTGETPSGTGIVANGWFVEEHNEVMMWRQSERLVGGTAVWERGRVHNAAFTCLKHFWWPGMASSADWTVNVRPVYFADGRKSGDAYCNDPKISDSLRAELGDFPLFQFWGPGTNIKSSQWIADSAAWLLTHKSPTLALVYVPHMDYNQQRYGPDHPSVLKDLEETDAVVGGLIDHAKALGYGVMVVSDYQMTAVSKPIHLNRMLREKGWLKVTRNAAGELIDYGTSAAFAVSDHQTAQIYVQNPDDVIAVEAAIRQMPGVADTWSGDKRAEIGLDHERAGDVIVASEPDSWFTYYYWLDESQAPDFARTVAIHAKPGYDPCEMLIDPKISCPKLKLGAKLIAKKLGMRTLFDVCPLDAGLIKGSHGLLPRTREAHPVLLSSEPLARDCYHQTDLPDLMLGLICGDK